jgi:hypothetical protein
MRPGVVKKETLDAGKILRRATIADVTKTDVA